MSLVIMQIKGVADSYHQHSGLIILVQERFSQIKRAVKIHLFFNGNQHRRYI